MIQGFSDTSKFFSSYAKTFYAKDITVQETQHKKPKPKHDADLKFGHYSTDHMMEVYWDSVVGWDKPKIVPYHNLEIDPFNSTIHYAIQCFEGMKAYIGPKGEIRMFRPEKNMERFKTSCERISLPFDFDTKELLECTKKLLKVDKEWIPNKPGFSIYIRPTAIAMTDVLGVRAPDKSMIFVVNSPVGPYYPTGFKPITLYTDKALVRAFMGGSGHFKIGANYGPTIRPSRDAEAKGYNQVLWLTNDLVTEVGTSNIFFLWKNKQGEKELVTAPLEGLILPGVTRESILDLAREWKKFKVTERNFTMKEVVEAIKEGRVIEAFGAGTAATVSPIRLIHYEGKDYDIPIVPEIGAGKLAKEMNDILTNIQYGIVDHPWSVVVD